MKLKLLTSAAALFAMLVSPASAAEKRDGKYWMVIGSRQAVSHIDPGQSYDYSIRMMTLALYDGLVKYTGNPPEVEPWLATDWTTSEDGLVWTFNLAPEATFHNGDPVTAEAVVYSYKRVLELNEGASWMLSDILQPENIKALDAHTVEFTLDRAYAPFLSFLPWWFIVNPAQVEANVVDGDYGKAWLAENDAGSGPYEMERFDQGTAYWLARDADYWKGFPYESDEMGGVIYRMIQESSSQRAALMSGEADLVSDLTPEEFDVVAGRPDIEVTASPMLATFGLKINTQGKLMSDINLRKAVAYAFDYETLLQIYNGKATLQTSPFADAIKGKVDIDMPRQDMAKAKDYLSKTPWPEGGITLEYVYVQGLEEQRQMGLSLLNSLKELNIELEMVPLTWSNMVARASSAETSPDLMAVFATPVSTDPDAVAIQYHPISNGKYYGSHFIQDDELTALIDQGRKLSDWEERAPIYAEIQQKIVDIQPEIFGMLRMRQFAHRDYVKGFVDTPIRMSSEIDLYPIYIQP
ncbi:ABC transporter substrate-binding protein [Citreicella sp. C3M06]|uniref:ABC transporter substrate-binding protein n=1 Tax=Citreicella sp. C3M06 TaxID=2841564 RepID=UPI001C09A6D1|nr:ABC transporter substrate-binding protein [Citreicella sp. C3M06]MBU2961294.1 ABC transporter substrate-binding protein [Citreicella sp. C3M06]